MNRWKEKFDEVALERGRKLFQDGKVEGITQNETLIKAALSGIPRCDVSIALQNNTPARMKCQCPKSRSGRSCEHMAAVLYAVYGDDVSSEQKEEESKSSMQRIREEELKKAIERHKAEEEKRAQELAREDLAKEELAKRIAEGNAQKAAKRAERKKKRAESEERVRLARQEEELKKAQTEARKQQEQARKQQEEARKQQEEADDYTYFDFKKLRASMKSPAEAGMRGQRLCEEGRIILDKVQTGYSDREDGMLADVQGIGRHGNDSFPMRMILARDEVKNTECRCPQCRKNYSTWYYVEKRCDYMAGLLQLAEEYLREKQLGDATDKPGMVVLTAFQEKRAKQVVAQTNAEEESLSLVPRVVCKGEELSLSFRIGAGKLYVVKDLIELCENIHNSETVIYGTGTKLNLHPDNFTKRGREWFRFINQVVQEEERLVQRMEELTWYSRKRLGKCSSLELYGWRLDQFFQVLGEETVEYEERGEKKKKLQLHCRESNPKMQLQIRRSNLGGKRVFHGIDVTCRMPVFYQGVDDFYYIDGENFCRADREFMAPVLPMAEMAAEGGLEFQVGRDKLSEFYYSVLPQLSEVFDITEEDFEEIHSYLPPEVQFFFYLDAEEGAITCRLHAKYGEREVSVLELLERKDKPLERYRMGNKEAEVLHLTRRLFPEVNIDKDELSSGTDEEQAFYALEQGVETLAELGEVQCTQRFRNQNVIRRMKVSVGVSVESGLLNLDISTEDIPREELLDILRSYRLRKKFYRLKNGDFLKLEDDNTLEMLGEMMEAMHLSPKDFVAGKLHLPAYRTLYLDKLLEENAHVYSTRDSHFREMVKNFKTVNDADYEVPASLESVLRGYQKKGYRWLRTLAQWQLGGILADDMGLGKTLQAITLLLAAKEENQGGTSLVVTPASLIFNWGEELSRYAPGLKVQLVAGSQEERQKKLEEYEEYDVLVTSYDLLKRDITAYEGKQFLYEIIDEAQYIKNQTTAASKAVKVVRSRLRLAMTGTPIENRLSELWSIFDYLMPGFLYTYEVFKKEIETPVIKNGDEAAMKRLQRLVGPFILRRLKGDVLRDLPDKLEEIRYVKFDETQQRVYDAQVIHMQEKIAGQDAEEFSKNKLQILAELMKLRQICCDPSLCFENYTGESAKLEACLELVRSAIDGGHKLLLFSQFTTMLETIQKRLTGLGIAYYTITGATGKEKRLQLVKGFNRDDTPVFLISLKAGGVGLNLTGADVVIHYDPWWNLAVQNQATDRAHRIGQTRKVTVYKLIIKKSIEEKIQKLQESKKDLAEQIVNAQTGQLGSMTKEELLEILEA